MEIYISFDKIKIFEQAVFKNGPQHFSAVVDASKF